MRGSEAVLDGAIGDASSEKMLHRLSTAGVISRFHSRSIFAPMPDCCMTSIYYLRRRRNNLCVSTAALRWVRKEKRVWPEQRERLPDQTVPVHTELPCQSRLQESCRQCHWPHRWAVPEKPLRYRRWHRPKLESKHFQRAFWGKSPLRSMRSPRQPTQPTVAGLGQAVVMHLSTIRHFLSSEIGARNPRPA